MNVSYDRKSFYRNGKRIFLNSAAIHYFRMPREEWRGVLLKAKHAGMNCVDTYFAWNIHEQEEGVWDFAGDKDCGAFLDLCAELGLWVIARPGPYICAEWDFGGLPWWLNKKEGIRFRQDEETFLHYVDRYFDQIIPIIRKRQISEDGTVILVQVENEYGYLGSDEQGAPYLNHLRDGLLKRGIRVPLISCAGGVEGAIEGANFWSGADNHYANLIKKQPETPKIVTEFWTGWFEHWGAPAAIQKTPELLEKRMMEAVRAGFAGLSHYMFFGGTNFAGYGGRTVGSSDIFMVTSYDYDAPLNEYGETTEKYFALKRVNYFINTISEWLLEAEELPAHVTATEGLHIRARGGQGQILLFAESSKEERETFYMTLENGKTIPVTVKPGQIVPVVVDYQLTDKIRMTCNTYFAGNEEIGGMRTLLIYADKGQRSLVEFTADQAIEFQEEQTVLYEKSINGKTVAFDFYHFQEPQIVTLNAGGEQLRLIVLNADAMDRTWRKEEGEKVQWVIAANKRRSSLLVEAPVLEQWQRQALQLTETQGVPVNKPLGFSEFGEAYGHLLYSCEFVSEETRNSVLIAPQLQDTARVYLNGIEQALVRQVGAAAVDLNLRRGSNRLQVLVQNMGRLNFSPFLGEQKGLFEAPYLDGTVTDLRKDWESGEEAEVHLDRVMKVIDNPILSRSFYVESRHDRAVLVGAMSANLRINGNAVPMDGYRNWFAFHTVDISSYIHEGENRIEMEYFRSPIARLELMTFASGSVLKNWSMAKVSEKAASHNAVLEQANHESVSRTPAWLTCRFVRPSVPDGCHVKLRLTGMSKGAIWLNGMNLGRYWQIGPQEDYKLPVSWLQENNELVLFDEEGRSPAKVKLIIDQGQF